jgi:hypothetical protein
MYGVNIPAHRLAVDGAWFCPSQVVNVLDPTKAGIKTHVAPRSNRKHP